MQNLYGHTEAITCLAASSAYGILVSGSRDRSCIIWDLNKLTFVRQLGSDDSLESEEMKEKLKFAIKNQQKNDNSTIKQSIKTNDETILEKSNLKYSSLIGKDQSISSSIFLAPISAICINDLSGDIAVCSGTQIFVYTINADLLACVDIFNYQYSKIHNENRILSMLNAPTNVQILCCTFSLYKEWNDNNIFCVGCSDGTIKIYTIRYIQIPIEDQIVEIKNDECSNENQESVGDLIDKVNELTNKNDESNDGVTSKATRRLTRSNEYDSDHENINENMMVVNKDEMVRRMSLITVQAESQAQDDSSEEEESKKDNKNNVKRADSSDLKKSERKSVKRKGAKCPKLDISTTHLIDSPRDSCSYENNQKLKPG